MDLSSDQITPDRFKIDTPELVAIETPLAGIGSRFIALLVDSLIWIAGFVLLSLLFSKLLPGIRAYSRTSAQWTAAIEIFAFFLLNWGYFTLFEAFWNGRTPGKRVARIRVIQRSGRAIGLFESMARNLIRYVDQIPFFYAVGIVVMFMTRQHQRLGDLAAGTLVVRDDDPDTSPWSGSAARTFTAPSFSPVDVPEQAPAVSLPSSGIAKLSAADLEVLESFFSRRFDLDLELRQTIAQRISSALMAKCGLETPADVSIETFLEAVAHRLRDAMRMN